MNYVPPQVRAGIAAAALTLVALGGCSSPYSKTTKHYDVPRDQLLIRRMNEARDQHRRALALLRNASEPFQKITTLSGSARTAQAARIQRYVGQCDGATWEADKAVLSIQDVLRLYFTDPAAAGNGAGKSSAAAPWRAVCDEAIAAMAQSSNIMKEAMVLLNSEWDKIATVQSDRSAALPPLEINKLGPIVDRLAAQVEEADKAATAAVQSVRDARPTSFEP